VRNVPNAALMTVNARNVYQKIILVGHDVGGIGIKSLVLLQ